MASSSHYHYHKDDDVEFESLFEELLEIPDTFPEPKERKKRIFIERNREEGHINLWNDYFSETPTYPPNIFRRRFRMSKSLFLRIVHRLSTEVAYFAPTQDAVGRSSLSPLQKCTAAIRQLAYGGGADTVDEYVRLGETTARKCLHQFTAGIIHLFGDEYLRHPTGEDLERPLAKGEERGFPGMVGSIDCTMNDLNILDRSPVFDDIIKGIAPQVNFNVNGREYDFAYYLTDGIYPEWATFIQSIRLPQGPKHSLFAKTQESVRKDVERAFGVLQARFAVIKNPSNLWDKSKITNIMRACIILHNMIVEDERRTQTQDETFQDEDISFCVKMPTELFSTLDRRAKVRGRPIHRQLKLDLIEHIWDQFGFEN
uniref:DDE Tnp4 domain-containing protein n=1 Tax=Brassica oleracea var. oleracea TaxID=109376 RepID=A0A0D3BZ46_BRAOL